MTIREAIAHAEAILPGTPAPEGELDPRWQAIIAIGQFIETDPDCVWFFLSRWGDHPQADLRAAIATCLLEHLLEYDFEMYFPRTELLANLSPQFADTMRSCWVTDLTSEQRARMESALRDPKHG